MSKYNGVMMQYFHWYTPVDGNLWKQLAENAKALAEAGVKAAQKAGLQVYADVVFNHKLGGDDPEEFNAADYNAFEEKRIIFTCLKEKHLMKM